MEYEFNTSNFEKEVIESEIPVLVDFYATWCNPCKMMSGIVADLAEEYAGRVKIGKVDIDKDMGLSEKYGVMSVPTFIFLKKGEIVEKFSGAVSKQSLIEKIQQVLT